MTNIRSIGISCDRSLHFPSSSIAREVEMRRAVPTLVIAAAASLTGCAPLEKVENRLVYQPAAYPAGDWTPPAGTEDANIASTEGLSLHGWFAAAERPRAVVLFLHGNAGNVTLCKDLLALFPERFNASILAFDYRGYGRSEGSPNESGVLDDARAARRWLAERCGVAESDIVLMGHSLGGGVAVDLAAADGARGLVLWNTFTSLPDVGKSYLPLLPVRTLMHNRLDSLAKIGDYRGPLLQAHGDSDRIVPFALGRRLFAAANEPKQFVTVRDGRHNDPPSREFLDALDRFLSR
ncbi:MAG TPA: alpha/beta hydrolase [Gemmataceae bacterium]